MILEPGRTYLRLTPAVVLDNTVFLAHSVAAYRRVGPPIRDPLDFRARLISKSSCGSGWWNQGKGATKRRTYVVLGKSRRMVISPLPDVQDHASPRPHPSNCSSFHIDIPFSCSIFFARDPASSLLLRSNSANLTVDQPAFMRVYEYTSN